MSTLPDLMDAYRDLADHAPAVADLHLAMPPTQPARRGTTMRALLATLIAVIAVAALVVYLRSHVSGKSAPPAEVSQPRWPDSYSFGPDSLPGYRLDLTGTQIPPGASEASTDYEYTPAKPSMNLRADLSLVPASKLGRYRDGTPVRVHGRLGYYQAGPTSPREPPWTTIAWPISKDSWAVLTVGVASYSQGPDGKLVKPKVIPTKATTVGLAESVRLHESPTVAPVKVGYLPANLKLLAVTQVLDNTLGEPNAPPPIATTFDNRFGRSYRDLKFVDRSVQPSCPGQRGSCPNPYMYQTFTLDVGVLFAPHTPLELKDLPDARTVTARSWTPKPYNPANQWTQMTIAGHRAFVSAHDVIVDWGGVEVHVTNEQFPFAVKPVLSRDELIRVAASLTVPPSAAVGNGYPLSKAVPAANLH